MGTQKRYENHVPKMYRREKVEVLDGPGIEQSFPTTEFRCLMLVSRLGQLSYGPASELV